MKMVFWTHNNILCLEVQLSVLSLHKTHFHNYPGPFNKPSFIHPLNIVCVRMHEIQFQTHGKSDVSSSTEVRPKLHNI
jgi:hypothetical protein